VLAAVTLAACGDASNPDPPVPVGPLPANPEEWVCRPKRPAERKRDRRLVPRASRPRQARTDRPAQSAAAVRLQGVRRTTASDCRISSARRSTRRSAG
jgi:hypothetical protein